MNTQEIMVGDQIKVHGITVTIGEIISQDNYGRDDKDDWYVEFKDTNGRYRYWKQQYDGGTLIRITSK